MKASYVLPCYIQDEEIMDLTKAAIESFKRVKAELVVTDDCSPIGGGYLRQEADTYIRTKENEGYYRAINKAIKLAKGDILAFTNNDIRVAKNWLEVSEEILKDKEVGSVHFKMILYKKSMTFGDKIWKTGKERWCTTSFLAVKREVIEKVGLFDEGFGHGGFGDYDFWHRVRLAGFKAVYTNKSCYQHKDSAITSRIDPETRQKFVDINEVHFRKKWGKHPDEMFAEMFPEQMKVEPWRKGFE